MANKKKYQLVIVESPTKAKTIEKFLGGDFVVRSSQGHIRDLKKNNSGVDIKNGFLPVYVIPDEKQETVAELTKLAKGAEQIWLASDEDREGEAISWHLAVVLNLDVKTTKRIVFHEITKGAILKAIESPRHINMDLVDAQQARRVLDRIVGFDLSSVLWRKVKNELSAGRVQSVAVRILVDREREILAFSPKSGFSVSALFGLSANGKTYSFKADLNTKFDDIDRAEAFLRQCAGAKFSVSSVESKNLTRQPAPPFTTSTLQQEASRKLGLSPQNTMRIAQELYEAGLITYMRTDSVNLSDTALEASQKAIESTMGAQYHQRRQFRTNTKGAQEAHEAIRPTDISVPQIQPTPGARDDDATRQVKLYHLIWLRTVASQMADAQIERTTISIDTPDPKARFTASANVIKFDGFMKLYLEGSDSDDQSDDSEASLPGVVAGQGLNLLSLDSRERWSQKPPRYNEAALVKKLEEMGIGRPSTYAPTISTIMNRGYVVRDSREGTPRKFRTLELKEGNVVRGEASENVGAEKNKLFPTDIAMVVTDFLMGHFSEVMSYDFTANVETQFDDIALGKLKWQDVIRKFYEPFHLKIDDTLEHAQRSSGERELGVDPKSGEKVFVRIGRFGPMAQIGETVEDGPKPRFASLRKDQHLETISLDEALKLFDLPRNLGSYEDKDVVIGVGRFGPYIRHDGKFISLKKEDDPYTIDLDTAITRIEDKREADRNKLIKKFDENPDIQVLNGRWGPYIAYGKANVKIPKGTDAAALTLEQCLKFCEEQGADPTKRATRASAKKTTASQTTDKQTSKPTTKKSTAKSNAINATQKNK